VSAYVVIEATVRDVEARERYASQAGAILEEFEGETISFGAWHVLYGEAEFNNGMIIRFSDKETALAWYNSPAYQALIDARSEGLDCRFRLLG
jgi:uncharacterized protein (DUF1330 family)